MALSKIKSTSLETDASNFVKLHEVTAANQATLEFDNTYITSDYDIFKIYIKNLQPVTDSVDLFMRVSSDNGSTYINAQEYRIASLEGHEGTASDVINSRYDNGSSKFKLTGLASNGGNGDLEKIFGEITFYNSSVQYKIIQTHFTYFFSSAGQMATAQSSQCLDSNRTTRMDAIQFFFSSGNINKGDFILYGVKT
jgi:hypothetical protein